MVTLAAAQQPQVGQSPLAGIIPMFVVIGVMMFILFRSQKKQAQKRQEMLSKIKVGDEIITNGGIKGKISKVKDKTYMVKIADKVEIEIVQNGVGAVTEVKENE